MKYRIIKLSGFFKFECQYRFWWWPFWVRLKVVGASGWFTEKDEAVLEMYKYLKSGGKVVWQSSGRLYLEKEYKKPLVLYMPDQCLGEG